MLTIEVEPAEQCTLVRIAGELDHATAPDLQQQLLATIDAGDANLVINGRGITYISSAGLRALVAAQARARRSQPQGQIVFSELSAAADRTFRMVGFNELFQFYPTDTAATGSFG